MADILRTGLKGEANLGVEHHVGDDMARLVQDVVFKLCAALVAAALLVCGALMRDTAPLAGNLSWFSTSFCAERRSAGVDVRVERKKEINTSVNKTAHAFSLGMGACFTAAHPSSRIPHG